METNPRVVTFGELLIRLDTIHHERLIQARDFRVRYTGAEANAAVALQQLGTRARVVSVVPANELGRACTGFLEQYGVDTRFVRQDGPRLGILYVEAGASVRPSVVVYDRAGSSFSQLNPGVIDWDAAFKGADWFHWSGTAPALAPQMPAVVSEAVLAAKRNGLKVSCDLNYRSKLWTPDQALAVMPSLMDRVDLLIANEEHIGWVLGERVDSADRSERAEESRCEELASRLAIRFGFEQVAITLRENQGVSELGWRCLLSDGSTSQVSRRYSVLPIDRVGAGDAFAGALIHALLKGLSADVCIEFAAAAGCLKHTIPGDFLLASEEEVWRLTRGEGIGRVQR